MGFSCRASVVVGVHLENKTRITNKTKYDEDTGKPHIEKVESKYWAIEGTDIEVPYDEDSTSKKAGIVYADYEADGSYFFGIEVERTTDELWFEFPDVEKAKTIVKHTLKSRFGYDGEVKVFVLNNLSY